MLVIGSVLAGICVVAGAVSVFLIVGDVRRSLSTLVPPDPSGPAGGPPSDFAVPGRRTYDLPRGDYLILLADEHGTTASTPSVEVRITGPSGAEVVVSPVDPGSGAPFDDPPRVQHQVVGRLAVDEPGRYRVDVRSSGPGYAGLSPELGADEGHRLALVNGIALGAGVGAAICLFVGGTRRARWSNLVHAGLTPAMSEPTAAASGAGPRSRTGPTGVPVVGWHRRQRWQAVALPAALTGCSVGAVGLVFSVRGSIEGRSGSPSFGWSDALLALVIPTVVWVAMSVPIAWLQSHQGIGLAPDAAELYGRTRVTVVPWSAIWDISLVERWGTRSISINGRLQPAPQSSWFARDPDLDAELDQVRSWWLTHGGPAAPPPPWRPPPPPARPPEDRQPSGSTASVWPQARQ